MTDHTQEIFKLDEALTAHQGLIHKIVTDKKGNESSRLVHIGSLKAGDIVHAPKKIHDRMTITPHHINKIKSMLGESKMSFTEYRRLVELYDGENMANQFKMPGTTAKGAIIPATRHTEFEKNPGSDELDETGMTLDGCKDNDQLRRMKAEYRTEAYNRLTPKSDPRNFMEAAVRVMARIQEGTIQKSGTDRVSDASADGPATEKMQTKKKPRNTSEIEFHGMGEDVHSADYKVNPDTGRKYRARHIEFAASKQGGDPSRENEDQTKIKISNKPLLKVKK